jgi:hypothetical protein
MFMICSRGNRVNKTFSPPSRASRGDALAAQLQIRRKALKAMPLWRFGGERRRPHGSVLFPKPKGCRGATPAYGGARNARL